MHVYFQLGVGALVGLGVTIEHLLHGHPHPDGVHVNVMVPPVANGATHLPVSGQVLILSFPRPRWFASMSSSQAGGFVVVTKVVIDVGVVVGVSGGVAAVIAVPGSGGDRLRPTAHLVVATCPGPYCQSQSGATIHLD